MCIVQRYTEAQARAIAKEKNVNWCDVSQILRCCSYCNAWVSVDEQAKLK